MRIPGKLPFLEQEGSEIALLQQYLHQLKRHRDLCNGELEKRLTQEFPRLLQGRRKAIDRLLAAAAKEPQRAHYLRGQAYMHQTLLLQDTALYNKLRGTRLQHQHVQQEGDEQRPAPASEELFSLLDQVNGGAGGSTAGSSAGSNEGIVLDDDEGDGEQPEYDEAVELAAFAAPVPLVAAAHQLDNLVIDADPALAEPARLPAGRWVPSHRAEGVTVDDALRWAIDDEEPNSKVVCRVACHGLSTTLRKENFATLTDAQWLDSDVMAAAGILLQVCIPSQSRVISQACALLYPRTTRQMTEIKQLWCSGGMQQASIRSAGSYLV